MTSSVSSVEFAAVNYDSRSSTVAELGAPHPVQADPYWQPHLAEEESEDIDISADKIDEFLAQDIDTSSNDECANFDIDLDKNEPISAAPLASLASIPFIDTDSGSACDSDSDSVLTVEADDKTAPDTVRDSEQNLDREKALEEDRITPDMSVMLSSVRGSPIATPTSGNRPTPNTPLLRSALKKQGSRRCLQVVINEQYNTYHELRPECDYEELRLDSFSDSGGDESDEFHESDQLHETENDRLHETNAEGSQQSPPFQLSVAMEATPETLSPPELYKDRVLPHQIPAGREEKISEHGEGDDPPRDDKDSVAPPAASTTCCQCVLDKQQIMLEAAGGEASGDCEGRRNLPDVVCVDGSLCGCLHHHHHHVHHQDHHHSNHIQKQAVATTCCSLGTQSLDTKTPSTPQHTGSGILKGGRLWNESPSSPSRRSVRFSSCVEESSMKELVDFYSGCSLSENCDMVSKPEEFNLDSDMAGLSVQDSGSGNGGDKDGGAGEFWCVQHLDSSDSETNSTVIKNKISVSQGRDSDDCSSDSSYQAASEDTNTQRDFKSRPKEQENKAAMSNKVFNKEEAIRQEEDTESSLARLQKVIRQAGTAHSSNQPTEQPPYENINCNLLNPQENGLLRTTSNPETRLAPHSEKENIINPLSQREDRSPKQSRALPIPADVRQWRMTPPPSFNCYSNDPNIPPPPLPPHGVRSLSPATSTSSSSSPTPGSRLADARRQFVSALTGAGSAASLHCLRQRLQRRPIGGACVAEKSEVTEKINHNSSDKVSSNESCGGNADETGSVASSSGVVSNDSYSLDDIDDGLRSEPLPIATDQRSISPPSTVASSNGSSSGYSSNNSRQITLADTDGGSGDELERFVAVQAGRTARLRQRYGTQPNGNHEVTITAGTIAKNSANITNSNPSGSIKSPDDDGGFLRRPSVRSIRPRFGSTQQIFQQLQQQHLAGRAPHMTSPNGIRHFGHHTIARNVSPIQHRFSNPSSVRHHGSVPVLNVGSDLHRKPSPSMIGASCGTSPIRRNRRQSPAVVADGSDGYVLAEYTPPLPPRDSQIQCTSRTAVGNSPFLHQQSPALHYRSTPNLCPMPGVQYCTGSLNRNQTPPTPHPRTILPGVKYHHSPMTSNLAHYTSAVLQNDTIASSRPMTMTSSDTYNVNERYMHDV